MKKGVSGEDLELEDPDEDALDVLIDDDELPEDESDEEDDPEDDPLSDDDVKEYRAKRRTVREVEEEKRAIEAERDEAVRIARAIAADNERLKKQWGETSKATAEAAKADIQKQLEKARAAKKRALEDGDVQGQLDADEEIQDLKIRSKEIDLTAPRGEVETKVAPVATGAPRVHPKATAWLARNAWFGENDEAREHAVLFSARLEKRGVPPSSDDYYKAIDAEMKKRFPEVFDAAEKPTKVMPVRRETKSGGKGKRSVTLTARQVQIARKWNVPVERFAREVRKLEAREGA